MSKVAEVTLLYNNAKWALLFGLGYLAARNPRLAARVGFRLGAVLLKGALRDTGNVTRILYQELAKPVLTRDAALVSNAARMQWANLNALGPVFGPTIFLTTGGGIAVIIDQATEYLGILLPGEQPGDIAY